MDCSILGFLFITNSQRLLRFMCIESMMLSNHLILYRPLLLPSIFPSIRGFSHKSALYISWPKYWRFSFSISLSNEYSGMIYFRIYWCDFLAVKETLKSLLQHHSSKASIIQHSAFFLVLLSHPNRTTRKKKIIALTRSAFVGKMISLLFDMLSSFVIAYLSRNKRLLTSRLKSPSTVILEPKKMKSVPASISSSFICHEIMGPEAMILVFEC